MRGAIDRADSVHSRVRSGGDSDVTIRRPSLDSVDVPLVAQSDVQPVAPVNVQPEKVIRVATKKASKSMVAHSKCATSGTRQLTSTKSTTSRKRKSPRATPKPIVAHEWKYMDSGWALFSRKASISASGKRSSTRKYLRWYTQAAIERIYGTDQTD
jgi:hypothetical protein